MRITGIRLDSDVAHAAPQALLEVVPRPVKSSTQLPPLSIGQEVKAEIVDELEDGLVLVHLAGAFLTAEASDALPLGAKFVAQVEQLQPQVVLRVLIEPGEEDESTVQAEAVKLLRAEIPHHTSAAGSLGELTQELTSFIEQFPQENIPPHLIKLQTFIKTILPEQGPPTAAQLAAFIRDGGLHYEAKLFHAAASNPQELFRMVEEDLKAALLQALQDLNDEMSSSSSLTLAASLTRHLEHIESQQAVNILAQAQGGPYQVQIPFFTAQRLTTAFLSLEPEGKGNGETERQGKGETGKGYNILFALDLENFGQTRIDARIGQALLWAVFYVDQPESVALLQRELPDFRITLQSLGYADVSLMVRPLRQLTPEKREKFEALTIGVPASIHLLDTKA